MTPDPVTAAISEHALPLDTSGPVFGADRNGGEQPYPEKLVATLSRLCDVDGSVVVGLGETTHGTRECFQVKAGLIRLLVECCGIRTVAFEANVTATHALDTYVRQGEGDPVTALDGLHKWMWRVESVRDLLLWLRSFNRGRPADDQVRVRGVDLSHPAAPAELLRSYLRTVDPEYAARADPPATLTALAGAPVPDNPKRREQVIDRTATAGATLGRRLDDNRPAYTDAAGSRQWERARQLCRVVERTCDWHRVRHEEPGPHPAGMQRRDRHMASNVEWCLRQDPGDGVAVWAHNIHVERGSFDDGRVWANATGMGEFLTRALGERYVPVGFDVGRGRFRAVPAGEADQPQQFTFDPPSSGSATAQFERVDDAPWLLDIRAAATDPRLRAWVDEPQRMRCVGTVCDPDASNALWTPPAAFDALVFVDRSTPSRPVGDRTESCGRG